MNRDRERDARSSDERLTATVNHNHHQAVYSARPNRYPFLPACLQAIAFLPVVHDSEYRNPKINEVAPVLPFDYSLGHHKAFTAHDGLEKISTSLSVNLSDSGRPKFSLSIDANGR